MRSHFLRILVLSLAIVLAGTAAEARAEIRCELVSAGAQGSAGDVLAVRATEIEVDVAAIIRSGQKLIVTDDRFGQAAKCAGGTASVTTIDRIEFRGAQNSSLALDLREGVLGPGASPEADGSSEIEVEIDFEETGYTAILGAPDRTDYLFGTATQPVADLNGSDAGSPEVDISLGETFSLIVRGDAGRDSLVADGGGLFESPMDRFLSFEGGPGADNLIGGSKADLLNGGPGPDELTGGPGRDELDGGPGGDRIDSADGVRDDILCAGGRDRVEADPEDRLSRCERVVER